MSITTGGILEGWGPEKAALRQVIDEVRDFAPRVDKDDYCIDVAFRSWHNFREPEFTEFNQAQWGEPNAASSSGTRCPRDLKLPLRFGFGSRMRSERRHASSGSTCHTGRRRTPPLNLRPRSRA